MKINNLNLIWVVLAGIVFSITACKSPETNNISEMNILHLVVEDWSADAVGCYGNDIVQTPHTDALAAKGVMFNRAYCQATVCNPSRASFTTGIRPDKIKVYGNDDVMDIHVPEGVEFMPAILKTNGAYTAQLGKLIHHWRHARRWVNDFNRLEYPLTTNH